MQPKVTRISLKDAIARFNSDEVNYSEIWDVKDDEFIELRHPMTLPMKYVYADAKEAAEMTKLDEEDPRKKDFVERRNFLTFIWAFANWRLYDPEGEEIPPVSPKNTDSWYMLSTEQQMFLNILVGDQFYNKEEENAMPKIVTDEGDDPLASTVSSESTVENAG